jgi:hypothetical protein
MVKKTPQRGSTCSGSGLPLAEKLSAAQDTTLASGCPQDGLAGPSRPTVPPLPLACARRFVLQQLFFI